MPAFCIKHLNINTGEAVFSGIGSLTKIFETNYKIEFNFPVPIFEGTPDIRNYRKILRHYREDNSIRCDINCFIDEDVADKICELIRLHNYRDRYHDDDKRYRYKNGRARGHKYREDPTANNSQ